MQENCRKSCKLCANLKCNANSSSPKISAQKQTSLKLTLQPPLKRNQSISISKKKIYARMSTTLEPFRRRA